MKQETQAQLSSLIRKLEEERNHHLASVEEIDSIIAKLSSEGLSGGRKRGPGRPRGSRNKKKTARKASKKKAGTRKKKTGKKTAKRGSRGLKPGGQRVQGVKEALAEALTATAQSPAELQAKVSKKVGADVSIATQLHMLKRDGVAKSAGRGQWVKA